MSKRTSQKRITYLMMIIILALTLSGCIGSSRELTNERDGKIYGRVMVPVIEGSSLGASGIGILESNGIDLMPLSNATILVDGEETLVTTDEQGRFVISGLPRDDKRIITAVPESGDIPTLETIGTASHRGGEEEQITIESTVAVKSMRALEIKGYADFARLVSAAMDSPRVRGLIMSLVQGGKDINLDDQDLITEVSDIFLYHYYPFDQPSDLQYQSHFFDDDGNPLWSELYYETVEDRESVTYTDRFTGEQKVIEAVLRTQHFMADGDDEFHSRRNWVLIEGGRVYQIQDYYHEDGVEPTLVMEFDLLDELTNIEVERITTAIGTFQALKITGQFPVYDEYFQLWLAPEIGLLRYDGKMEDRLQLMEVLAN